MSARFLNFDVEAFLREYWQKKPLLIKNPWGVWTNPLEPDELAGLACEAEVESRLISRDGGTWNVEDGPLPEARFTELGEKQWTLLVQAVDHYVPAVAALIEPFRFIPNWRIDDVMVSLAADQGGVGPHFDQYDVFLIQGSGRRRWQVGTQCSIDTELLPNDDLRLLANFEATDEWVLEPGDILYVPPGIAHDGVALSAECMTYSIGFRAPSRAELISDFADHVTANIPDDDRYADPGLCVQANPGEITPAAIDGLHNMIIDQLGDRQSFVHWFGKYNSTPKYPDISWKPDAPFGVEELREMIAKGEPLVRNPAIRFSFIKQEGGSLLLFVDGESFECVGKTAALAKALCAADNVSIEPQLGCFEEAKDLLIQLFNQGSVTFEN